MEINEFHQARKLLTEGKRLSALREYEAATKVLNEVIEGNPENAEAWYELAKVHHTQGNMDQRDVCINHVIELKPEWAKFTDRLRTTPTIFEGQEPTKESDKIQPLDTSEGPSFVYPYEMLDALVNNVLMDLFFLCEEGNVHEPFILPRSGFNSDDAIRILTLASTKGRQEEAYTGLIAYLKLRPKDQSTWKIVMALADSMNLKESIEAAKLALHQLELEEDIPRNTWDRFCTVEIPEREHPDTSSS
ncbi:MAG: tetratricopeptide repeat protein [Candidatus Thorarchaeota archaeon]